MKILFASIPADGHFNPLTGIAVQLMGRGHDVRWYAGPTYGARLDRLDMSWFAYERATEVMASNLNDLFPERSTLKGPKAISFDLDKFFVSQVENHYQDIAAIGREWQFEALVCDGALYAEQLVAESLHLPVFAVGLTMVMPDAQGPPPFFGLRPANTPLGRIRHAVVRKRMVSGMKAGTTHYKEILARHASEPIRSDGLLPRPTTSTGRGLLERPPGAGGPGTRPPPHAGTDGRPRPARERSPWRGGGWQGGQAGLRKTPAGSPGANRDGDRM